MSLLDKQFTGRLDDGAYKGVILAYEAKDYQTDKGAQEAVVLTLGVGTATYDFVLFEKPFEWAIKDIVNKYYKGMKVSAKAALDGIVGKQIDFSLYTSEYAGRKFQRLSFNPSYSSVTQASDDEQGDLEFNQ